MDFDRYTISLLIHRSDAPNLDEAGTAELQEAHMSHLADLREAESSWRPGGCSTSGTEGSRS